MWASLCAGLPWPPTYKFFANLVTFVERIVRARMPRSVFLVVALLAGALGFGPSSLLRGSRVHSACRRAVVPLLSADGVGTSEVRWLAPLDPTDPESAPSAGAMVMPLFPLGVTYLPYTSPVLNIFEPRYRAMYNDILFSGARRFMVCNVDSETGRMAEVGVIFYLDELKEVSEQTQDRHRACAAQQGAQPIGGSDAQVIPTCGGDRAAGFGRGG
jgi:hypothetical protein